jgi:hypothetical protein
MYIFNLSYNGSCCTFVTHAVFRREISPASIVASRSSEKRHQLPGNKASVFFF